MQLHHVPGLPVVFPSHTDTLGGGTGAGSDLFGQCRGFGGEFVENFEFDGQCFFSGRMT